MKHFYTFLLLICCFSVVKAQKNSNIYFVKNNGQIVDHIDSADFIRVVKLPDSATTHFQLLEYYKNKNPKRVGYVSAFKNVPILEGIVREFYPDKVIKELSFYEKNKKIGLSRLYHENGVLHEQRDYGKVLKDADYLVKYIGDTLNNSFLDTLGTGSFKIAFRNGNVQEGSYKQGLRDGNWKTFVAQDSATTEEVYKLGKFEIGKRIEKNGQFIDYTKKEILPEFKGGTEKFLNFVFKNLTYPREARDKNIQGRVLINFVVEKDGSLTDIKVLKDIGGGCGEEAVRVIALSPKWKPGLQDGKPVKVSYSVPIVFNR